MTKELQTAVIFGIFDDPKVDSEYYLAENIIIGKEDNERGVFIDLFTGREYYNVIKSNNYGLETGYGLVLPLKNFYKEKKTKTTKDIDETKCQEYYDFLEDLIFVEHDEHTLYGVKIKDFEEMYNINLGLKKTIEINSLMEKLMSENITDEELSLVEEQMGLYDPVDKEDNTNYHEVLKNSLNKPISEVINELKKSIINQDEAIKKICISIYKYALFGKEMKNNILIYGPSGVGKTCLINELSKIINYPVLIEDMTSYTVNGFQGSSVEDILLHLYNNASGNLKKAEHSILFLDEIDKKASKDSQTEIANGDVLKSLLKIIEGGEFTIETNKLTGETISFDTSNLLIIAGGAFTDLYNQKQKEKRNTVGFNNEINSISEPTYGSELSIKEFEKFGMPLEFMARFKTIIRMNSLTLENLIDILKNSNLSELKKYNNVLEEQGIKLNISDETIEKIARLAYSYGTGARGLNIVVNNIFENILYELFDNKSEITEVNMGKDITTNKEDFSLKRRIN